LVATVDRKHSLEFDATKFIDITENDKQYWWRLHIARKERPKLMRFSYK